MPGTGIANIALGTCLGATVIWRLLARRAGEELLAPFRRTAPVSAPIGAFVALSVASCFFSTLPSRSLLELKGFGTFLLVPFALAHLKDDDDVHLVLDAWRVTTAYLVVRGLVDYAGGQSTLDNRLAGGMSAYMTYAGLLMTLAIVLVSRGVSRFGSRLARFADLAIGLLAMGAVGLTLTRNAYLGLGVGALVLFASARPKLVFVVPVAAAAFYLLMPATVRARALSALDPTDVTMRVRLTMWRAGANMIGDRPVFGLGPGRVKELYPVYRRPGGFGDEHPGHLHNNLVMIAAETGLPSLAAYLGFVGLFFVNAWRRCRLYTLGAQRSVARGAMAAMASLFAAGLFEYNFGDVEILMATLVLSALPFCLPPPPSLQSAA